MVDCNFYRVPGMTIMWQISKGATFPKYKKPPPHKSGQDKRTTAVELHPVHVLDLFTWRKYVILIRRCIKCIYDYNNNIYTHTAVWSSTGSRVGKGREPSVGTAVRSNRVGGLVHAVVNTKHYYGVKVLRAL